MNATADDWTHVEPLLDDAMEALEETDRTAVLLRYFQNKSLREVGQQLGVSDDAAQKRVSRAVNRLRDFFVRREVKFGTSGFVALISANAVQAAPAALVSTVSAAAIAGTALTTTIAAQAAATTMNWISLKTICATVTTAIATGTGVYLVKEHQVENLRFKNQELISNQQTLTADRDAALAAANSGVDELERLQSERNELLRLRGEVTRLRSTQAELERLRDANASLQASLESSSTPVNPIADPLERQKQVTRVKLTDGMHRAAQLVSFATDYEGWYPTNWLGTDRYTNDFAVSELNSFEMVYEHPFHRDELGTNWGRTIVVREVYAWPTYDGQWGKVYGFIDGHAQTVILPDGNFAAWEAENTFNPDWLPQ